MDKVRVRYAPSPTGLLHIGNARTAIFNYLYAKHYNGDFIIRIEDTDVKRNVKEGEASQLKYLKWLGLSWDEGDDVGGQYGPYHQLQRLDLYTMYANKLLEMGLAYKEYKENSQEYGIRFKVPTDVLYSWDDLVRGTIKTSSKEVEDWIIMKDNGIPTYNFAVVVDDHLMKISHVLRGEEHITNTPKQIMVYQAFGWEVPKFGHMTIIVNEKGKKLSKRDASTIQFISQYHSKGYLPEALFNFISLLGWSSPINQEILSKDEIIKLFDSKRLTKAPSYFDREKLKFLNSKHLKKLSFEELKALLRPFLLQANIKIKNEKWFDNLVTIFKDRITYGEQIVSLYNEFFSSKFIINEEEKNYIIENNSYPLIKRFYELLDDLPKFEVEAIENIIKQISSETLIKGKELYIPLRVCTTSHLHGPSLPVMIVLLGKTTVKKNILKTIKEIGKQL
ncbi:MAG: glutamate--tRNA ligase [Acholeplasmatales bacterium]|jgi:glutamyl-tRNA synthetase/nondiscriminating glutamyl-tRNA synthetase|nr:glutamate--tRNA ligase [Acholeplasmatales bacterium]